MHKYLRVTAVLICLQLIPTGAHAGETGPVLPPANKISSDENGADFYQYCSRYPANGKMYCVPTAFVNALFNIAQAKNLKREFGFISNDSYQGVTLEIAKIMNTSGTEGTTILNPERIIRDFLSSRNLPVDLIEASFLSVQSKEDLTALNNELKKGNQVLIDLNYEIPLDLSSPIDPKILEQLDPKLAKMAVSYQQAVAIGFTKMNEKEKRIASESLKTLGLHMPSGGHFVNFAAVVGGESMPYKLTYFDPSTGPAPEKETGNLVELNHNGEHGFFIDEYSSTENTKINRAIVLKLKP
jgi:hypothetical protein